MLHYFSSNDWQFLQQWEARHSWPRVDLERARAHGMLAFLTTSPVWPRLDRTQQDFVKAQFASDGILHAQQRLALEHLDNAPGERQILVFKGWALASTIYSAGALRPRIDVDLLVPMGQRVGIEGILRSQGYVLKMANSGLLVQPERSYTKADVRVSLDLHWALSSLPWMAKRFPFDKLWHESLPLDGFKHIRMPNRVDSLLIAVVHQLGHHRAQARWIWFKDMDLLWREMDSQEQSNFVEKALRLQLGKISLTALETTKALFETPIEPTFATRLAAANNEPSLWLQEGMSYFRFNWLTLTWPERVRLLSEHAFPEREYLYARFPRAPKWTLPWLHVKRWLGIRAQNPQS